MSRAERTRFILLPPRGVRGELLRPATLAAAVAGVPELPLRVIDEVRPDGAKLVELSPEELVLLRLAHPGVRIVPLRRFTPALAPRVVPRRATRAERAAAAPRIRFKVTSRADGDPVADAAVVAFSSFEQRLGAEGKTSSRGEVTLQLPGAPAVLERVYVFPARGFWSLLATGLAVAPAVELAVAPIAAAATDSLRHFFPGAPEPAGAGVTVGVVDTGIDGGHPGLVVDGGRNMVVGEKPSEWGDNGQHHGTHVAGIIASRGTPPTGVRGVAPGVSLRSYRVFGEGRVEASNYSIVKAIDAAVEDGCDLVNMSLGGGEPDDATRAAIEDARERGSVVVVAAGNDGRGPVSFPASDSLALAVSALGRVGTFPDDATEAEFVAAPRGRDRKNFVAGFSNVGPEIDLIGPGVAVVSTVPGGLGVMSGTSMACPAVTGAAARLLAAHREVLGMARGQERSDAIARTLLAAAYRLGFGPTFEGQGLPRAK